LSLKKIIGILGERFSENIDFICDVIENLNLDPNSLILDIGTGRGKMAIILALSGFKIITGEPEGHNWADWQNSASKINVLDKITFKNFQAENLPFEDSSFDVIFANGSFHHFTDKIKALSEIYRIIKPKPYGKIIIFEFTEAGIEKIRKKYPGHPDATNPVNFISDLPLNFIIKKGGLINAYIFDKK